MVYGVVPIGSLTVFVHLLLQRASARSRM
jgi:hypothetical protein